MAKTGKAAKTAVFAAALMLLASPAAASDTLPVLADGHPYPGRVRLEENTAYVALREFVGEAGEGEIVWDPDARTASVTTESLRLTAADGDRILAVNDRLFWCTGAVFAENGTLWVPLRPLSEAFGYRCEYLPEKRAVSLTRERTAALPADALYTRDEVFWLARIIEAEAGGESFEGKLAVGSVVLNRVEDEDYPDTIWGVIFDTKDGVQFTPTVNGTVWGDPGTESIRAAEVCLGNPRPYRDVLYFINEDLATNFWVPSSRRYIATIGRHDFYGD